jgi:hypothetical protein
VAGLAVADEEEIGAGDGGDSISYDAVVPLGPCGSRRHAEGDGEDNSGGDQGSACAGVEHFGPRCEEFGVNGPAARRPRISEKPQ